MLWRQVLADQRVNSPFQKFKRNFLLLLQILLLALLVLAAMQPFLRREVGRADRLPILIDVSASMGALDRDGGATRLAEVKKRVRDLIDGLPAEQELSLVAFSKNARRLTPFTNNQRELRAALDALEVEDLPSDLEEALRMAQALARTAAFDKVLLFSDGNFPAQTNFELPFKIDYQRVAPAGSNYGITACSARRAPGGRWEVFVQLGASAEAESATGTVELLQDGAVVATETVPLTKGASPRLAFTLASEQASTGPRAAEAERLRRARRGQRRLARAARGAPARRLSRAETHQLPAGARSHRRRRAFSARGRKAARRLSISSSPTTPPTSNSRRASIARSASSRPICKNSSRSKAKTRRPSIGAATRRCSSTSR